MLKDVIILIVREKKNILFSFLQSLDDDTLLKIIIETGIL